MDREDLSREQYDGFMKLATHCCLGAILLMSGSRLAFFYKPLKRVQGRMYPALSCLLKKLPIPFLLILSREQYWYRVSL